MTEKKSGWLTNDEIDTQRKRISLDRRMVLRPDPNSPEGTTYRVRFLGDPSPTNPYKFFAHYAYIVETDSAGRKVNKKKDFPDKLEWARRICTGDRNTCPWCMMGYLRIPRWITYVIDRKDNKVKLLEMPKSVFASISMWWRNNYDDFPNGPGAIFDEAPDFNIVVLNNGGKISYVTHPTGKSSALNKDDLRAIKEFYPEANKEKPLPDIVEFIGGSIRPTYMDYETQLKVFGKIVQENPFETDLTAVNGKDNNVIESEQLAPSSPFDSEEESISSSFDTINIKEDYEENDAKSNPFDEIENAFAEEEKEEDDDFDINW